MKRIELNRTNDTPGVVLDAENKVFEFSGRSLPENVSAFYMPIFEWLNEFSTSNAKAITVTFKMEYFNTASSKMILDIMMRFKDLSDKGCNVKIQWYYLADDEEMLSAGKEYEDIAELPFEFLSI